MYLASPRGKTIVAGVGVTLTYEAQGCDRFQSVQKWIQRSSSIIQQPHSSRPLFFCQFTFFPDSNSTTSFPSGRVILPRWQILYQDHQWIGVVNLLITPSSVLESLVQEANTIFQQLHLCSLTNSSFSNLSNFSNFSDLDSSTLKAQPLLDLLNLECFHHTSLFRSSIQKAISLIQKGYLEKVVLARSITIPLDPPFLVFPALRKLSSHYGECHTFLLRTEENTIFLGSSPERLLTIQNHQFVIDALAGSAPRGVTSREDLALGNALMQSQKDHHEHHLVVQSIYRYLAELGIHPQGRSKPYLRRLANIQHLQTLIQGNLPTSIHPLELVAALHPTAAVAGSPRELACEVIQDLESFIRGLYAAPLGWVDTEGNAEFVVGIRSACVERGVVHLYGGAGIVSSSDPDQEVAEVQLKLQTLLRHLRG
jgi:menaquinone-specific isochorismate synthase